MYCKQCHYPLVGLGHATCPECGRAFVAGDPLTFDPNPWSPKLGIYQWVRFVIVISASLGSAFIVWHYGYDLLLWNYAQKSPGNSNLTWLRRRIGGYEVRFVVAGLLALSSLIGAVFAMRRSQLVGHVRLTGIARCFAFAAATWWIGWYLAMRFGYLLFPLYPMTAYDP